MLHFCLFVVVIADLYIGETKRSMKRRMTKHRCAVKKMDVQNGTAVHVCTKTPTLHQLGVCQSVCNSKRLLGQKDPRSHTDTKRTTFHELGLWPTPIPSLEPNHRSNLGHPIHPPMTNLLNHLSINIYSLKVMHGVTFNCFIFNTFPFEVTVPIPI